MKKGAAIGDVSKVVSKATLPNVTPTPSTYNPLSKLRDIVQPDTLTELTALLQYIPY